MVRYALLERPISKIAAGVGCFFYFVFMFVMAYAFGGNPKATFLIALVSYGILIRSSGALAQQRVEEKDDPAFAQVSDDLKPHAVQASEVRPGFIDETSRSKARGAIVNDDEDSQIVEGEGLREKISRLSSFEKTVCLILLVFVLLMVFYFTVSPYQQCTREISNKTFCLKNTSW
jgi:hypothetical protein